MTTRTQAQTQTATHIRSLARQHRVVYSQGPNDTLAQHITRLAGDVVEPDEIEKLLFALQRAGHLTRKEMIRLQAKYLRETRPWRSIRSEISTLSGTCEISNKPVGRNKRIALRHPAQLRSFA